MAGKQPRSSAPNHVKIPGSSQFQLKQNRSPAFYAPLPDRARSSPMPTPNAHQSPPPPLPPPRWVEDLTDGTDPGWDFENRANRGNLEGGNSAPIKLGSSLLGGPQMRTGRSYTGPERKVDLESRPSLRSTLSGFGSEGSDSSNPEPRNIPDLRDILEYNKLQSEKQMSEKTLERSSQAYDKQLLSRIGGLRGPNARPGEVLSPGGGSDEPPSTSSGETTFKKTNGQLRPLAMPERRHSDMDARSPQAQWTPGGGSGGGGAPPSSAASPRFSGLRSPLSEHGLDRTPSHSLQRTSTIKSEESQSMPARLIHRDSYEQSAMSDQEYPTQSPGIQQLNISDRSPNGSDDYQQSSKTGEKRRATSPPSDSVIDPRLPSGAATNSEAWQRQRMHPVAGRNHPQAPRFHNSGSLSSAASSTPQNASYPSSYGPSDPSTSTSYNSERLSPSAYTTSDANANANSNSPHANQPVHPPARIDPNNPPPIPHRRTGSSNIPRAPGLWICDCCPKKPKKFESEDELRIHEMEKQYICQYCHNRFKNKNEAERHQNSLHLRRHSWSCAALTSFEAAFHSTPSNSVIASIQGPNTSYNPNNPAGNNGVHNPATYPGALHSTPTDTCGYCGVEFVNPPNWDDRVEHLNHIHKFGECNQSKKFFRADHFRQHLKHSHAGTSGKWTNMLENACMKDEPPPQPMGQPTLPPGMPGITMVGQQQLLAAAAAAAAAQQSARLGGMPGYGSPSQTSMGSPGMMSMGQGMVPMGAMQMPQQAGQQAMMNATGPMGGGGPPAPIASMMAQQQQQMMSPTQQQNQHAQQQAQQAQQMQGQ